MSDDKNRMNVPHIYEFEVEIWHPEDGDSFHSTTFVAQYPDVEDADNEALHAAEDWLVNLHHTLMNTSVVPGWDVHVRTGDFTWYNYGETKLLKQEVRFVGKAKIGVIR